MKKRKFIIGLICLTIFFVLFYYIFLGYKIRSNFSSLKTEMYSSTILSKEVGNINKIYFDNYINWYDNYNGEKCIKFNLYNKNKKKIDICTLIWVYNDVENNKSELKALGYILNDNKIIYDIPIFDLNNYNEKLINFNKIETNMKINNYIDLKSVCRQYLNLQKGFYDSYFYDSSNNVWLYIASLYNVNSTNYEKDYYKNIYIIINPNGQILGTWEKNF